jgi:hypothetical protein
MKKITTILLLLVMSLTIFSQQTEPAPSLTKQDYLKKAKRQQTAAWILGGSGLVLTGVGLVVAAGDAGEEFFGIFDSNVNDGGDSGAVFAVVGLAVMGASVPLFIAAARNKKRAASLTFKNQFVPQFSNGSFVKKPIPSLSLKISI